MTPYLDDGDLVLYHGDVIDTLRSLPAGVAQTCITSPPYWGLRDYQTGSWTGGDVDHEHDTLGARGGRGGSGAPGKQTEGAFPSTVSPEKCSCGARRVDSQLGLEATPQLYVERMVAVFREVWRVLRDDGTCWINLGDSYATGTGTPSKPSADTDNGYWQNADKLGRSRIDGREAGLKPKDLVGIPWRVAFALQADGWYLRSDIIWSKPNPMPESVTDRPTKAHEYLFLLTKQPRYYFDQDAIREPHDTGDRVMTNRRRGIDDMNGEREFVGTFRDGDREFANNPAGRNRRSVWTIPTQPFPEAHFATFPEELVRPCILAGSRVGDTVLDPFVGSGTTCLVARKHGRRALGIDLSSEYLGIAARRLQQLSLFAMEPSPPSPPATSRPRGLTGGAYSPPGQSPHSNARGDG